MRRKARTARKATVRKVKAPVRRPRPKKADAVGALVAASAPALGLAIDPAWEKTIRFNLELLLRHAALVDEFPLPDEIEPAPVFHA